MSRNALFVIAVVLSLGLWSCSQNSLTDQLEQIEGGWKIDDHKFFKVDVQDSLQLYDFYINIRNSVDYPYANVFFFLTTHFPNGQIAVDTVECFLADRTGKWLGSGLGKYKDSQILFRKQGRFPMTGLYQFEFEQAMYDEMLTGIDAVGIRIEESTTN